MNTAEIVKLLAQRFDLTQKEARDFLDSYTRAIAEQMLKRRNVIVRGYGTYGVKEVPARRSYVPSLKAVCDIPAHRKIFFRAARRLKEEVAAWRPQ